MGFLTLLNTELYKKVSLPNSFSTPNCIITLAGLILRLSSLQIQYGRIAGLLLLETARASALLFMLEMFGVASIF